jgi:hypothetical protein
MARLHLQCDGGGALIRERAGRTFRSIDAPPAPMSAGFEQACSAEYQLLEFTWRFIALEQRRQTSVVDHLRSVGDRARRPSGGFRAWQTSSPTQIQIGNASLADPSTPFCMSAIYLHRGTPNQLASGRTEDRSEQVFALRASALQVHPLRGSARYS